MYGTDCITVIRSLSRVFNDVVPTVACLVAACFACIILFREEEDIRLEFSSCVLIISDR